MICLPEILCIHIIKYCLYTNMSVGQSTNLLSNRWESGIASFSICQPLDTNILRISQPSPDEIVQNLICGCIHILKSGWQTNNLEKEVEQYIIFKMIFGVQMRH